MDINKALDLLRQVAENYHGTLQEHNMLQQALSTLQEKLAEKKLS